MRISDWSSDVCSSDLHARADCNLIENLRHFLENLTRFDVYLWQDQYFITLLNRRLLAPELQHSRVIFRSCKTAILPLYYNPRAIGKIGRASCRERVCQYV